MHMVWCEPGVRLVSCGDTSGPLREYLRAPCDTQVRQAVYDVFLETDATSRDDVTSHTCGTTANTVLILQDHFVFANAGDGRTHHREYIENRNADTITLCWPLRLRSLSISGCVSIFIREFIHCDSFNASDSDSLIPNP